MAFIGSLITTVKANTGPFKKNLAKASKATKGFRRDLKDLSTGVGKVSLGVAAVATGALVAYTVQAFKAIDATAKLASEMDISTASLTAYQLAAGLAGTDTATLNKALQRMARTVGEARSGITTGTKALEDFNITVEELKGLSTEQIFEEFAERISLIPDPLERAAKSALIFGKSGQKLLNFLSLGKTGLADVKAELGELGIAFSEVDAAKVEAANDAILKLTTVATGLGNTLAISVAPFITEITNKMTDFIKESGGIDTVVKAQFGPLLQVLKEVAAAYELARVAGNVFANGVKNIGALILTPIAAFEEFGQLRQRLFGDDVEVPWIKNLRDDLAAAADEDLKDVEDAWKRFEDATNSGVIQETFNKIKNSAQETAVEIEKAAEEKKKLAETARLANVEAKKELELAKQISKERQKAADAAQRIFNETRTPLEKIEAEIVKIKDIFEKGGFEGIEEAFDRKIKELEEARKKLQKKPKGPLGRDVQEGFDPTEGAKKIADEVTPIAALFSKRIALLKDLESEKVDKDFKGAFRQLDLKNLDIAGFDRSVGIEEKQLDESVKSNELLKQLVDAGRGSIEFGAVAQ